MCEVNPFERSLLRSGWCRRPLITASLRLLHSGISEISSRLARSSSHTSVSEHHRATIGRAGEGGRAHSHASGRARFRRSLGQRAACGVRRIGGAVLASECGCGRSLGGICVQAPRDGSSASDQLGGPAQEGVAPVRVVPRRPWVPLAAWARDRGCPVVGVTAPSTSTITTSAPSSAPPSPPAAEPSISPEPPTVGTSCCPSGPAHGP